MGASCEDGAIEDDEPPKDDEDELSKDDEDELPKDDEGEPPKDDEEVVCFFFFFFFFLISFFFFFLTSFFFLGTGTTLYFPPFLVRMPSTTPLLRAALTKRQLSGCSSTPSCFLMAWREDPWRSAWELIAWTMRFSCEERREMGKERV